MARLRNLLRAWRRRGLAFPFYVVAGVLWPRLLAHLFFGPRGGRRLALRWSRATPRPGLPEAAAPTGGGRRVIGRIDNDGRLLPAANAPPGFDTVAAHAFVERYRYGLELVRHGETLLVRKDYRGDRDAFHREATALAALAGLAGVPALHGLDPARLVLEKTLIPGRTLRQLLVAASARILSVETEADSELAAMAPGARLEAVWARGRERFATALAPDLLARLERRLEAIHARGVTGFSLTFGNVVVDERDGEPTFIDFDAASIHRRPRGWRFALGRDADRGLWNRIYGRELLTEAGVQALLACLGGEYAPLDLGRGLATRGFWSVDSGTGRWDFLNARALRGWIEGRRILDLGSHNGLMPLLMLRAGAREVVAVERSAELAALAGELRRLFEWRDLRSYALEVRNEDMLAALAADPGPFDLVTTFCSLYYLGDEEMARAVRRAAELAPAMVVQAKVDTRTAAADDKARKSSLGFLQDLLATNGFPHVDVVAPPGYSRPLLIGHRDAKRIQGAH